MTLIFQSIFDFFAFGTFGFWILFAITSVIFTIAVECQKFALSIVTLIILGAAYHTKILQTNWRVLAIGAGIYILIGLLWSVSRWQRYVTKKVATLNKEICNDDVSLSKSNYYADRIKRDVDVSENKELLISWIAYWPWSLLWNFIGDFFNFLYEEFKGIYEGIAKSALKKVDVTKFKK